MPSLDTPEIVLAAIAVFAAFVNGAIGYGFSSLTVPVALVFYANRVLNPAVVVIEVFLNIYVLLINLKAFRLYGKGCFPFLSGYCPALESEPLFLRRFNLAGLNSAPTLSFCPSSYCKQPVGGGRSGQHGV